MSSEASDDRERPSEATSKLSQLEWEIAERRRAERKTRHVNRVLRAIRSINQIVAREVDCKSLAVVSLRNPLRS